jgi:hypothetical protein
MFHGSVMCESSQFGARQSGFGGCFVAYSRLVARRQRGPRDARGRMRRDFQMRIVFEVTLTDADHDDGRLSASRKDFSEDLPSLGVKKFGSDGCAH